MNLEQFNSLSDPILHEQFIHVNEISGPDRTLMFGYNCNRDTFHLYWMNGAIHSVYYNWTTKRLADFPLIFKEKILASICVPNKRVYPARCDYEFCKLLLSKGVYIPFTTFEEVKPETKIYYGLTDDRFQGLTDYTGWY